MAEYSREQRNQLSRAIVNSKVGSKQLKKNMDGSLCSAFVMKVKDVIQGYWGVANSAVKCKAKVCYSYKKNGAKRVQSSSEKGEGGSDFNTSPDVIGVFTQYGFNELANVVQAPGGRPPGVCAEPHAVGDALRSIDMDELKQIRFNKITVDDAVVANPTAAMITNGQNVGNIMPRCATCNNWVPNTEVLLMPKKSFDVTHGKLRKG